MDNQSYLYELSDERLVELIKMGFKKARDVLYLRYYPIVQAICKKFMKNHHDGEDVSHEVMIKIFENKKLFTFSGKSKLIFWVKVVAQNECKTYFNKHQRFMDKHFGNIKKHSEFIRETTNHHNNPLNKLIKEEEVNQVIECIEQLKPTLKKSFYTRFFEDKNYNSSAKDLKITVANLRTRICRAKKELQNITKQHDHFTKLISNSSA